MLETRLVKATSCHMATLRLFGKYVNNIRRYWGQNNKTGDKEAVKQWKEDWIEGNKRAFFALMFRSFCLLTNISGLFPLHLINGGDSLDGIVQPWPLSYVGGDVRDR